MKVDEVLSTVVPGAASVLQSDGLAAVCAAIEPSVSAHVLVEESHVVLHGVLGPLHGHHATASVDLLGRDALHTFDGDEVGPCVLAHIEALELYLVLDFTVLLVQETPLLKPALLRLKCLLLHSKSDLNLKL